jgi:hypothetical protein
LRVGNNLVNYHYISKNVDDPYFRNRDHHVNVENLKTAQKLADVVDSVEEDQSKVVVFKITESHKPIYKKVCFDMELKDLSFYHRADLLGYSFYISIALENDVNDQIIIDDIKRKVLKYI